MSQILANKPSPFPKNLIIMVTFPQYTHSQFLELKRESFLPTRLFGFFIFDFR